MYFLKCPIIRTKSPTLTQLLLKISSTLRFLLIFFVSLSLTYCSSVEDEEDIISKTSITIDDKTFDFTRIGYYYFEGDQDFVFGASFRDENGQLSSVIVYLEPVLPGIKGTYDLSDNNNSNVYYGDYFITNTNGDQIVSFSTVNSSKLSGQSPSGKMIITDSANDTISGSFEYVALSDDGLSSVIVKGSFEGVSRLFDGSF